MKPSGFAAGFDGLTPLVVLLHYRGYGSQVVYRPSDVVF